MRPISKSVRAELAADPFMTKCVLCTSTEVQWCHIFTYSQRQIDRSFNILPACKLHHDQATPHKNNYKKHIREQLEFIALRRMTTRDLADFPKKNWGMLSFYLARQAEKFGWL